MQRAKFTLVELLVVIAIISILAGMLLPALRAAVDQARLTSCQGQLKQMALATGMYEADEGYFPSSLVDSFVGEPGGVTGWEDPKTALDLIFPYAPDRDLYLCPTSKSTFGHKGNYGHNRKVCVIWYTGWGSFQTHIKSSRVSNPAGTLLIMDAGPYSVAESYVPSPTGAWWYLPGTAMGRDPAGLSPAMQSGFYASDFIDGRHSGGLNLAWCDGHTSWTSGADMFNNYSSWFVP